MPGLLFFWALAVQRREARRPASERHRLDKGSADLVPVTAIGRMLDPVEAGELIRRPAAGSRDDRRQIGDYPGPPPRERWEMAELFESSLKTEAR
jgi:hypothetical protein